MTDEELQKLLDEATPGPWFVSKTDDTLVMSAGKFEVADISGDYNQPDTWPIMEANARLIASAPTIARELLEARATIREMALQLLSDDGQMADKIDELTKENERLREENAHLLHVMNED